MIGECSHKNKEIAYQFDNEALYRCGDCQLVFIVKKEEFNPRRLYENYYENELSGRFKFGIESVIRAFRFFRAFKIFTIYPRAKTILDVGSGRGFTLYYLKNFFGYRIAEGTQIAKNALRFSRERLGLTIRDKDLSELSLGEKQFDIISSWHVLEHVLTPEKYVKKMCELLRGSGKLIIEVPNFNSWTRKFTGKYWLGLDLKHHLTFFNSESLSGMLNKHGFRIQMVRTFSLEYSTFISVQSLVSLATGTDHLIFGWLQNGKFTPRLVFHIALFVMLTPICFIINLLLFFSKRGEVLLITASKKL